MLAAVYVIGILATSSQALGGTSKVSPVQKVIEMLGEMAAKGKQEKHEEQVRFAAFASFCESTMAEKQKNIESADAAIEQLNADIAKAQADIDALGKEIGALDADVAGWESDGDAATKVREKESTDFKAVSLDYTESIDAIIKAIGVLKQQNFDRAQAASLVQNTLGGLTAARSKIPTKAKQLISSFLQVSAELESGAPEANAYESQSGGVIEMLEKLKHKFQDELLKEEKEEMNLRHSYDMVMQDLHDSIKAAEATRAEKQAFKGKRTQDLAQANGDLADTTAMRDADAKYLADTKALCAQKSEDFENRQVLRAAEIEAIAKAVEILSSGAVSGAAEKHLPTLIQRGSSSSFAQLRSTSQLRPVQKKVAAFLSEAAGRTSSRILAVVAERVAADPFGKVKKMIKDLITKLMEEANEEAEHKGWCDTELATNQQTREIKTSEVDALTAKVDDLTATSAKLAQDVTDLSDAISEIDAAVAKATTNREEEKAKNAVTVKEAKEAQAAVSQALQVLKEFYAKAAEATSLLQGGSQRKQTPGEDAPGTFEESYKGMQNESGGVVGMLEVIESDFVRLETETSTAESQAAKEYDDFMADSSKDKALKTREMEHKAQKRQFTDQENAAAKKDLASVQEELDAALAYFEKLKPACLYQPTSYEDRVAARKEEIASLQEALKVLEGEDLA